jgi:hypothetical protein
MAEEPACRGCRHSKRFHDAEHPQDLVLDALGVELWTLCSGCHPPGGYCDCRCFAPFPKSGGRNPAGEVPAQAVQRTGPRALN